MKASLRIKKQAYRLYSIFKRLTPAKAEGVGADEVTQVGLCARWREMVVRNQTPLPSLRDAGFRVHSESDEDGILLYLFSIIGTTSRTVVDIGAAGLDGFLKGSNSANLIINHGWTGLLIDGDEEVLDLTRLMYSTLSATSIYPPTIVSAFVTAENIDELIRTHAVADEVDLLCLDIDGMDYWIWKAISHIQPRVVVIEYRDLLGPVERLSVPYRADFDRRSNKDRDYADHFYGASLAALASLAKQKGYRLVGCNDYCFNAFFIRSGIGEEHLPEVSVDSCFGHPRAKQSMRLYFAKIRNMPWETV